MVTLRTLRSEIYIATIIFAVLSISMAYLAGTYFSRPIIELEKLFNQAADGNLTVRATPNSNDEIGNASRSFNKMMEKINNLTYFDPVTNLPNYRVLSEVFSQTVTSLQGEQTVAVILFGADSFSRINERYGYRQGNTLLKMAADKIQDNIEENHYLFRGQSDEFVILCKTSPNDQPVPDISRNILKALQLPNTIGSETIFLNFNVGITFFSHHGRTIEELLKNAGFAKNLAKIEGPGQIKVFDADSRKKVLASRKLEESLALALTNNELFLVYQPIINLNDKTVRGMEALLRWNHPEEGLVPPNTFIPLAESSGLIHQIGHWVLLEACKQHKIWTNKGMPPLTMSVNISAKQFEAPGFIDSIQNILKQTDMNPKLLELELTESSIMHHIDENMVRLQKLQDIGIRISIDDFGTGYSSLSYMVRLPLNTLKIDRSFIAKLEENAQARAIVSTIIAMGHTLKLELIAEGIETMEQLSIIIDSTCKLGQGFYFSKPGIPEEIEDLL